MGTRAIYAARELSTAWAEYNQGFVQHPALIMQLELSAPKVFAAERIEAENLPAFFQVAFCQRGGSLIVFIAANLSGGRYHC